MAELRILGHASRHQPYHGALLLLPSACLQQLCYRRCHRVPLGLIRVYYCKPPLLLLLLQGKPLVSYHRSWSYFANRFGFELLGEIEPKPGLRPSPKHLTKLATAMIKNEAKVLLMEPWYPRSDVEKLLQLTGAKLVTIATTCGATSSTLHYVDWMNLLVDQVGQAHGQPSLKDFEAGRVSNKNP